MPDGVRDRSADVWEALLAVADLAGGDWPGLARDACVALVKGTADESASTGVRLLADLRAVFCKFGDPDALPTETVRSKLHDRDESPWGDWYGHPLTARELARLLREHQVRPRQIRVGDKTVKGYRREHLSEPWRRYLAGVSETCETCETPLASHVSHVSGVSDTPAELPFAAMPGGPADE
jgi:hypothetical protein